MTISDKRVEDLKEYYRSLQSDISMLSMLSDVATKYKSERKATFYKSEKKKDILRLGAIDYVFSILGIRAPDAIRKDVSENEDRAVV